MAVTGTSEFNNKINYVGMFTFKQSINNDELYGIAQDRCAEGERQLPGGHFLWVSWLNQSVL